MSERAPDPEDAPVTKGTFELKLKVLEQRLTLKLIAGLIAAQALSHVSLPPNLTQPAAAFVGWIPLHSIDGIVGAIFSAVALAAVIVKLMVIR